jgi:hypothetical protein
MKEINASQVLYIKLGRKGKWEEDCLLNSHTLRIGYDGVNVDDCSNGKWDSVTNYFIHEEGASNGTAASHKTQLKLF